MCGRLDGGGVFGDGDAFSRDDGEFRVRRDVAGLVKLWGSGIGWK